MTMLFHIPEPIPELSDKANLSLSLGYLTSRLCEEERTRTVHQDGRNENVAEHSLMLVKVAVALAEEYYPNLDSGKVAIYASLHDDVEAYVGDTPTDQIAKHNPEVKKQREARALNQLGAEFGRISQSYVNHVKIYEEQKEPEARFVRIVDKIMTELIHFPNEGAVLKEHYTASTAAKANEDQLQHFLNEYPDFPELARVKHELASYLGSKYLTD